MVDYNTAAAISGLTVIVGPTPNPATCAEAQTQSVNTCGVVASVTATTTTSANGTFSVTGLAAGTYMLMVGPTNGSYATLHRTVTIASGTTTALGTIQLTALNSTIQAWLADVNYQRSNVATPQSFANLVVDEYLEEQANLWAANVAAGTTPYTDAGVAPYQTAYDNSPGAMYNIGNFYHNIAVVPPGDTQEEGDAGYMSEQTAANACGPYGGNWVECAANGDPGPHYVDIAETADVWVGLGTTTALYSPSPSAGSPSCIFFAGNPAGPLPNSIHRK